MESKKINWVFTAFSIVTRKCGHHSSSRRWGHERTFDDLDQINLGMLLEWQTLRAIDSFRFAQRPSFKLRYFLLNRSINRWTKIKFCRTIRAQVELQEVASLGFSRALVPEQVSSCRYF